jgi:hypothetical protein
VAVKDRIATFDHRPCSHANTSEPRQRLIRNGRSVEPFKQRGVGLTWSGGIVGCSPLSGSDYPDATPRDGCPQRRTGSTNTASSPFGDDRGTRPAGLAGLDRLWSTVLDNGPLQDVDRTAAARPRLCGPTDRRGVSLRHVATTRDRIAVNRCRSVHPRHRIRHAPPPQIWGRRLGNDCNPWNFFQIPRSLRIELSVPLPPALQLPEKSFWQPVPDLHRQLRTLDT